MKHLTIKETVRLHRILWGYLAKTGSNSKGKAFDDCEELKGLKPCDNCFACEQNIQSKEKTCAKCIFDWRPGVEGNKAECSDYGGPFFFWRHADNVEEYKKYAAIVRDLPLKKQYQRYLK